MKNFGPLYALSSKDKVKVWKANVTDSGTLVLNVEELERYEILRT